MDYSIPEKDIDWAAEWTPELLAAFRQLEVYGASDREEIWQAAMSCIQNGQDTAVETLGKPTDATQHNWQACADYYAVATMGQFDWATGEMF